MDELAAVLERAVERMMERRTLEGESRRLRESLRSPQGLGNMIGRSPEMDKLYRILAKVAQSSPSRTDPGRKWCRQGTGSPLHSLQRSPRGPAVCTHRLRLARAHLDGKRTLRLRQRGVHRR